MLTATIDKVLPVIDDNNIDGWDEFPDNYVDEDDNEEVTEDGNKSTN